MARLPSRLNSSREQTSRREIECTCASTTNVSAPSSSCLDQLSRGRLRSCCVVVEATRRRNGERTATGEASSLSSLRLARLQKGIATTLPAVRRAPGSLRPRVGPGSSPAAPPTHWLRLLVGASSGCLHKPSLNELAENVKPRLQVIAPHADPDSIEPLR
jgi:hypothetical protein